MMQGGFGDADLGGNVGIAEAIEAEGLHQPFGYIEDAMSRGGLRGQVRDRSAHAAMLAERLAFRPTSR